jgi:chemotaxis signal transduction protein
MVDNLSSTFIDSITGVLVFNVGDLDFCLDIKIVISTIVPEKSNTITNRGYSDTEEIEYSNELIPLLNIHTIYGLKMSEDDNDTRILILDFNKKKIAFRVDNIKEIISINKKTRDSLKYVSLKNKPYLNGKIMYEGRIILYPDLDKIIRDQKSYRIHSVRRRVDSKNDEEPL